MSIETLRNKISFYKRRAESNKTHRIGIHISELQEWIKDINTIEEVYNSLLLKQIEE